MCHSRTRERERRDDERAGNKSKQDSNQEQEDATMSNKSVSSTCGGVTVCGRRQGGERRQHEVVRKVRPALADYHLGEREVMTEVWRTNTRS